MNEEKRQSLLSALDYIDPTRLEYEVWLGAAIAENYALSPPDALEN